MPPPSFLSTLLKRSSSPPLRLLRPFSSGTPISFTLSVEAEPEPDSEPETHFPGANDNLRARIFRLRFPKRSATAALDKWASEGKKVTQSELRQIAKDLRKSQRYKHALEIMSWMESRGSFRVRGPDHAEILDLITKVHSFAEAESYFDRLSTIASQKAAAFPLLHFYVKGKDLEKAEALMQRLLNSGLAVNPYLFNEMMKLYTATGEFEKVLSVIRHMKHNKVPLNSISYSLWLKACGEVSGVSSVETVYKEMTNEKNVKIGWSTYTTLAVIYTKAGRFDKAFDSLKIAEKKLSFTNRLAYFFIMTCYAALKDKDGVLRAWELSKKVPARITCVNYMTVMSCLIKIGDIVEAEKIFREWELHCRNYDVRVSNVLLGAYMRSSRMDKAEALHLHTLERGCNPNYKTWEILMEGWVKKGELDKAVEVMKKGFSKLRGCIWRPPSKIVLAVAEHFERQGDVEETRSYVKTLHSLGLMSLPLYKSALRTYIKADASALDIIEMLEKQKIELDGVIRELIDCAKKRRDHDFKSNVMPCPTSQRFFLYD